jgi:hypothetical protein
MLTTYTSGKAIEMESSWMEGRANLVHQVARARHEERVARSLEAFAALSMRNARTSPGWGERIVRFARRIGILSPVRIAGQLR